MDRYLARAKKIIENIDYATLATATKDGRPWNSPVFAVHDSALNIYWFSDREGQHSRNVRDNPRAFIVIYDSTVAEGKGEGVYIDAVVTELSDPGEIRAARRLKKGPDHDAPDDFMSNAVRRVYKASPRCVWTNSAEIKNGAFIRDYRVELPLEELKQTLKKAP